MSHPTDPTATAAVCSCGCEGRRGPMHQHECPVFQAWSNRPTATAASIPYEGTDCTPDEAVEAVEAVRATAAGYYVVRYPHTTVDVNVCFRCGRHTADTTAHDEWHDGTTLP